MDIKEDLKSSRNKYQSNNEIFYDQKLCAQLNKYYKNLKILVNKRPVNVKGKSEMFQFKKLIIDLIKDNFKEKYNIFASSGNEIDLQLFIEYLCQLLEVKMSKMVEGYKIFENIDKNQLLLLSKSKNTIISFLICFYDFYQDELVINNEEVVAEIINKKNTLEDSFIITLIKTINLLNMPYITKDEFVNIFKEKDEKLENKKIFFISKDLGYLLLKIIEFFFKIRTLNMNMNSNKKKLTQKNSNQSNNNSKNDLSGRSSINKNNDQFSIFLGVCFEKIVPFLTEFFFNIILEYDVKNTISLIIQKEDLGILINNFNHIKNFRYKIFNILCNVEKIFNKVQIAYIKKIVTKNNLLEKILFFIHKDINNNKYYSLKDFLFEIKKVIKYYLIYNSQIEEIDVKIINIIALGFTKIKNKTVSNKNIKVQSNNDILLYFFKEINSIAKEEPEQKYKIYNFLIIIFQSSPLLRKYIYKILLGNFAGDLENYQDMLGHIKFLSLFVGNLCRCEPEILDYFFGFLHSLDKFKYFPSLELTNIIYSLTCFSDVKSIKILMNNLELYNNDSNINNKKNEKNLKTVDDDNDNANEKKDLLEEMNKSFLDIFSNIINDITNSYEEDNKDKINKNNKGNKENEQKNIFTAEMIYPLLEYINKIIQDNKIYNYFMDKNFNESLNYLINKNEYKIIAYKFIELFIKSNKKKESNISRINDILNRIESIFENKNNKNKDDGKITDEFEKIKEIIIILKTMMVLIVNDVLPDTENEGLNNGKDIKKKIVLSLNKCFEYTNYNKINICGIFCEQFHNLIKEYLNTVYLIFLRYNQNCINKRNINSIDLEPQYFQQVINNILLLYNLINENKKINEKKNYFFDIIIFMCNKALNIKQNINEKYMKDSNNDVYKYYINLLSIDEKSILDNSNFKNIYSNLCIQNPFLIITILNSLNKLNFYVENFLKFIYLLCKVNKGNISILLKHRLLFYLLNVSSKDDKFNNILNKIFELCFPFSEKDDLIIIFEYLIKSFNNNKLHFVKDVIQCLIDSFQTITFSPKEYGKGIILTPYEVKFVNIYNLINIRNIIFHNNIAENVIFVKQEILFCDPIDDTSKLILFRIDKNINNKNQFIEISIINGNLTASENVTEQINEKNEDLQINAKNLININELNTFVYKFDNDEKILSVIINRKKIFSYPNHFSFSPQSIFRAKQITESRIKNNNSMENYGANTMIMTIGYPLGMVKSFKDEKFKKIPYIKILSCSILGEIQNNNKKQVVKVYELDINNISIDSIKRNVYSDLTKFKLDKYTRLVSKYNSYESAIYNSVFHKHSIKTQLFKYLIYIDKYLSNSLDYNFRIEKYLFILLNNNNINKDIFKALIELLTNYIINNNENMSSFLEKDEIACTLYFILLKNAKFIDSEIIDILFSCFLSQKNAKNTFILNILLDYRLFDNLEFDAQNKALQLIINKKLINGKSDFVELLLQKLYIILLLCDFEIEDKENNSSNIKDIDELIISIIIGIFNNNRDNNEILKTIENMSFNLCKFHSSVKEHIEEKNKGRIEETHDIITSFFHKLYNSISIIKNRDILQKKIEEIKDLDQNYKDKLINIYKSYKPTNLSTNMIISSFRESIKKSSKMIRRLSMRNSKETEEIRNKFKNYNKELNIIEINDNLGGGGLKGFPKIVNEFIGGLKSRRKKTINEIGEIESSSINNNLNKIISNDMWFNSEMKNNKILETDKVICMGNCHLCSFIRMILNDLFQREINFNIYENYMLNNYIETYIFNKNLDYKIQFSNYLMKQEGTNRIRNRFKIKVDKVLNSEIQGNNKIGKEKVDKEEEKGKKSIIEECEINQLKKIFSFYKNEKISPNLSNFFNLGQIFEIDFISDCVDKGDTYQCSCNCLLFQGFNYINSIFILTEQKIYILTNMILDSDLIFHHMEKPIKKSFWIMDNYIDMIDEHCKYLQEYDLLNNKSKIKRKSSKFVNQSKSMAENEDQEVKSKQIRGFRYISFSYCSINEIHKKRFLHQNNAIEIFLKTGENYYIAFNKDIRDIITNKILQNISDSINKINTTFISNSNNNSSYLNEIINYNGQSIKGDNMIFMTDSELFVEKFSKKLNNSKNKQKNTNKNKNNCKIIDIKDILEQATDKWSNGLINTYTYIMILNTLSGRTYNDLGQYPVYPWILSDYSSDIIDLKESETYRDFSYPIYAQDRESRDTLKDKYNSFEETELKYHSGSHYSNPAFVCYYLVRIKPFSISASEIQGGRFDTPDRLFNNIKNFYKVQTKYQELIPDFFNLPEIYININNFNFGKTLDGFKVSDVILPPWAKSSPRLFSKMNKKALESQYVSQQINNWIDLIFGYKQKGIEAEKAYNVLREVCSNFNPNNYEDESEIELKINEICEMGIDPIQLFNKPHPKRERHQIMKAFFGRSAYLTYFAPIKTKYILRNFNNNNKIKEINKYYENISGVLSKGEGGLSAFRMCYEKNTKYENAKDDEKDNDIYYIVGENKKLIPPSYKNYIEWGNKNAFNIVKPFKNTKYKFSINHMKEKTIEEINITRDGKFIILGYNNGVIEKYVLQKYTEAKEAKANNENFSIRTSISNFLDLRNTEVSPSNRNNQERRNSILKTLISGLGMRKKSDNQSESTTFAKTVGHDDNVSEINSLSVLNTINISNTHTNMNISLNQSNIKTINNTLSNLNKKSSNKIIYDTNVSISFSNILNSDCILLNKKNKKFYQYNSTTINIFQDNLNCHEKIPGYFIHSINQSEIKHLSKMNSLINEGKNNKINQVNKKYFIFLVNSSSRILYGISKIEICESFSLMIITDKMNRVYLYNFTSFDLIKYMDFSTIFNLKIRYLSICPYTGDFIVGSKKNVILLNVNGIILSQMNNVRSKINSCFITLIPSTQSDIYLFTGHEDGDLIISKLKINETLNIDINISQKSREKYIKEKRNECVRNAYIDCYNNKDNNYKKYNDVNNLPLIFDIVIKIKCSQNPLKFIKITEDLTEIICIDNSNQLIYLCYKEFFNNKNKNKDKKNLKECPMCKSAISSSKILCYLCGKKLCAKCKIEEIIAEYSFKNKRAICEDCLQSINSTNKFLYDL